MKKILVAAMVVMSIFAIAGCESIGKGKAPVETNG